MKNSIKTLIVPLLLLAALPVMVFMILRTESEVIYRLQELSLFLPTRYFYLKLSALYPGGTLTWAAAFMTQFFYHPALGMTLMATAWGIIMVLICRLFRLKDGSRLLSLLVPLALMAALVQTGYWLYYMKLQGHTWVPTLGVLFALLAAWLYRGIPNRWGRLAWMTLYGILGYPIMGAWSFLGLGLMLLVLFQLIRSGAVKGRKTYFLDAIVAILLAACVPLIMVQWFYGQVKPGTAWMAAMPSFQYGQTDCPEYRWVYFALPVIFVIITLTGELDKRRKILEYMLPTLLIATGIWGVSKRWYRDTNFYKEVAMNNAIERLDWEGVLRIMLSQDMGDPMPPTRVMVMEKNLALFRLGRAGDEMFHYPEGAEPQHASWIVRMTQIGGKLLYYNYGKESFCYRWCMEDGVEFGWSVDVLKYMTKTSLLTHDWEVARKYINILKRTLYHRDWALQHEALIGRPDLIAENEEMKPIVPMTKFGDHLDGDNTLVEMYLLRTFSTGFGVDPEYQEMTLLCSLIMKDIDLFWPRFQQYVNMHQKEEGFHVPTHYQEAAYMYSMLEPQRPSQMWPGITNAEALTHMPFDESIKQSYQQFMDFNTQCGSMSEEQKKIAFRPQFGDTFYYFYFLVRNQKTN